MTEQTVHLEKAGGWKDFVLYGDNGEEIPYEILELSDSIIVMCQGKISGYFPQAKEMTEEELGYYMLGVKHQSEEDLRRACCEE